MQERQRNIRKKQNKNKIKETTKHDYYAPSSSQCFLQI